jgi:hypothetical protein
MRKFLDEGRFVMSSADADRCIATFLSSLKVGYEYIAAGSISVYYRPSDCICCVDHHA